jgi:hypothetical protein
MEMDLDDEFEAGTGTALTGFLSWAVSNCLYTAVAFFTLRILRDANVVDFSFTWQQVGIIVTAVQFARIWDRVLMR